MTLIRSKLREKKDAGMLGVVAASANVGEGMLSDWVEKPALSPSREELTRVEKALGLHNLAGISDEDIRNAGGRNF